MKLAHAISTTTTTSVLKVEGLRAGYDHQVVLEQVNFEVAPGEIRIILGGSGCGKSTLLNNIIGLEKPWGGIVHFWDQTLRAGIDPIPPEIRQRTGVLFQTGALISSSTLAENVALPLRIHRPGLPRAVIDEIVAQKLESVQMLDAWHKFPSELSGGMRKRAALARALALDPELLFCDEPSAGLDPVTSRSLDDLLLSLNRDLGLSIVIVTHELESIHSLGGNILFLSNGSVLMDGPLKQAVLSSEPEIARFFSRSNASLKQNTAPLLFSFEGASHGNI